MSDRRGPVKIMLLGAPLIAAVLALHAWGDVLAGTLGRRVDQWQYPEYRHSPYLIRVPRRGDADRFAAGTLDTFVRAVLKAHGERYALRPPAEPVPVTLLDSADAPRQRFGAEGAVLDKNEGLFDPSRRSIVVRIDSRLNIESVPVTAALQRAAARLLLHDAGSASWCPWLAEGLVGVLEGSTATDAKTPSGELPSLQTLLAAKEADFRGKEGAPLARGARLLAAYLAETQPEAFANYYSVSRAEGAVPLPQVVDRFTDLVHEEALWKDWLRQQK